MVRKSSLTLAALLVVGVAALAQPPGGGPPGGGGGMGGFMASLPPEARAKMQKWRTWRDNHKNIQQLTSTIRAINEMDNDPATKLTKEQAKQMMTVVSPWLAKPVMTEEQARTVTNGIAKALNTTQIKKYASIQAELRNRWGGGGGGGRMGGPGGGGPPGGGGGFGGGAPGGGGPPGGGGFGGGRPGGMGGGRGPGGMPDFSKMADPRDYNPLNPSSYPESPMSARQKKGVTDFVTLLKSRSA